MSIDLAEENARLKAEIERMRQEIERLKQLLEEALGRKVNGKAQPDVKATTPRAKMHGPWPARKKRAPEANQGRLRMEPTEVKTHELASCPDCGAEMEGANVAWTREVIDIPAVLPVQVTEHQVIRKRCPCCDKWHAPQIELTGIVVGHNRFGNNLVAYVVYGRIELRLPFAKIQAMLQAHFGLEISVGELAGMVQQAAKCGAAAGEQLKQLIRNQPVIHADETSWRESGRNGYVWLIRATNGLTWFEHAFSRATEVIEKLLPVYAGTLLADFYAVYNFIGANRQRCWAHLMRDLKGLSEDHGAKMPELMSWIEALKQLYRDANQYGEQHPNAPPHQRRAMAKSLAEATHKLSEKWLHARGHPAQAMCKRLRRHEDELFHFVRQAGVPTTNNAAERAIRPLVIGRKISGGTRSEAGTQAHMLLHSLAASWNARGLALLPSLRALLRGEAPVLEV